MGIAADPPTKVCILQDNAWVYNWQPVNKWTHTASLHQGRGFRYVYRWMYDSAGHKWAYGWGAETGSAGIGWIRWSHIDRCGI
jgi:hypothetical protein